MSMHFSSTDQEDAVFISYTHIDNQPFGPDHLCWISHLHEQLTCRVEQLYSEQATVWRDEKLHGNDVFAESLVDRLSTVAALVSVCSPRYLHSEWCRRELDEFVHCAEAGSGKQVGTKSRVFKVLKTPVPLDEQPEPLRSLLGYEFYEESPVDHRVREYLLSPAPEERWKFYARVDDLAQDIARLLEELAHDGRLRRVPSASDRTIYLAETTSDAASHRDNVKRELERRGHRVLPQQVLPLAVEELTAAVNADLARAELSIHLLGSRYGARPENEDRSIPHLQLDLASDVAARGGLVQVIWVPEGLESTDDDQAALVTELQSADIGRGVEVVRAPLEAFKAHALDLLRPPAAPAQPAAPDGDARVYLVHDRGDAEAISALQAELERLGYVVMLPLGEGTEAEAREVHELSMVLSDAVIIYYGTASEHWVRMKLFDLLKANGWGRSRPFRAKAVWVADPTTPHKLAFATDEALVLHGTSGPTRAVLEPFVAKLAPAATWR
jgi:TIR domain